MFPNQKVFVRAEKDNLSEANNRLAQLEQGEVAHLFSSYRSAIASVLSWLSIIPYRGVCDMSGVAYHIFETYDAEQLAEICY